MPENPNAAVPQTNDDVDLRPIFHLTRWSQVEGALLELGFIPWTTTDPMPTSGWATPEIADSVSKRSCRTLHDQPGAHLVAVALKGILRGNLQVLYFEVAPCCGGWMAHGKTQRFVSLLYTQGAR
jgi:hypothetical protein